MNKNIKLIAGKIVLAGVVSLLIASTAFAGTSIVLTPSTVNVVPGKTVTLVVMVNPSGTSNYAEKVELNYPADLLEVTGFTLASNWMALTQSEYDKTDNVNGVLVKSAGYPNGITSATQFGTVTFKAKKAGNATIKIGSNSTAYEANSQTVITGPGASVAITSVVVSPTPTPVNPVVVVTPVVTDEPTVTPEVPVTPVVETENQVAAVSESGFNLNWLWTLLVIPLAYALYYFGRKGNNVTPKFQ